MKNKKNGVKIEGKKDKRGVRHGEHGRKGGRVFSGKSF